MFLKLNSDGPGRVSGDTIELASLMAAAIAVLIRRLNGSNLY